ncbi:TPA: hypothetical protein ACN33D_003789 [Vibrio parahaemolyticus]
MQSLEELGFDRHYIGLDWYEVSESDKTIHIKNLVNKYDATNAVIVEGSTIDDAPKSTIGFAQSITTKYYSAAAIVARAICVDHPNAFFIQKLPSGKYWYLLVIDKCPAGGENDLVFETVEEVIQQIFDHYQMYDLHHVKLRYVVPNEITENISELFEESRSEYQQHSYDVICEAVPNEKFAQIQTIEQLLNTNPLSKIKPSHIVFVALGIIFLIGVQAYKSNSKQEYVIPDIDSMVKKASSSTLAKQAENDLNHKKIERIDKANATKEEAKWLTQRLTASDPKKVILNLKAYINSLPVDVGGWFPMTVDLVTKGIITRDSSTVDKPADQEFFHETTVLWKNGGTTVANFRDNIEFDGTITYSLSGEEITTSQIVPLPKPDHYFDESDAFIFIKETHGHYLDLLTFIQQQAEKTQGRLYGAISANRKTEREIPFKNETYSTEVRNPQIDYTVVNVQLSLSGFGWAFNYLDQLANDIDKFKSMIIQSISINLETEEIVLKMQYIHESSILNQQDKEVSLREN